MRDRIDLLPTAYQDELLEASRSLVPALELAGLPESLEDVWLPKTQSDEDAKHRVNRRTSFEGIAKSICARSEVRSVSVARVMTSDVATLPTAVGVLGNLAYERSPVSTYRSVRPWTSRAGRRATATPPCGVAAVEPANMRRHGDPPARRRRDRARDRRVLLQC